MKERSQYLEANYRAVFLMEYGDFPHPCYFCGGEVKGYLIPRDGQAAVVHHVDHDKGNNDPGNLVPAHRKCHTDYHRLSPETQARQRASQLARWARDGAMVLGPEARAKLSASKMGHEVSAETQAKISAANRGRKQSAEERARRSAVAKGKPKSAETRAKMSAAHLGKPSPFQGTHSPETIEKMRAARGGLSEVQRREVFRRIENGEKQVDLAAEFGVGQPYLSKILRKERERSEYVNDSDQRRDGV